MDADAIVIGLGAMGSASCFHLAEAGAKVIGIEQFPIGHALGSSHGETRVFRQAYFEHSDYVPLLVRSRELWRKLEIESGASLYEEVGLLYFCPASSVLLKGVQDSARLHGLKLENFRSGSHEKLRDRFRENRFDAAVFEPQAGFLRAEESVRASVALAERRGARILAGERVVEWKSSSGGVSVKTDKGSYSAAKLVLTAGPWTGRILNELNLPLKIFRKILFWVRADRSFALERRTPCFLAELPSGIFYGFPSVGLGERPLIKLAEHSGGTEILDPASVDRSLRDEDCRQIQHFIDEALVGVERNVVRHEVCMYTSTPDENFILDFHPRFANVVIASCCSGHGFKFAPVIGEAIKDLAMFGKTPLPIDFLKLDRLLKISC